jgi:LmbE family N-acetylglucosaminyl deacetylase
VRLMPHVVFAPCGLGGHVDHRIVRSAAEALDQIEVLYYEDVPYCASLPLAELDRQLTTHGLAQTVAVDIEMVLEGKCEDMWGYRSQTSASIVADMLLHAGRIAPGAPRYVERLWHQVQPVGEADRLP